MLLYRHLKCWLHPTALLAVAVGLIRGQSCKLPECAELPALPLILCLFFLLTLSGQSQAQPSAIINNVPGIRLTADAAVLIDSTGRKTINGLIQQPDRFRPVEGGINFGRNRAVNWVRFTVTNLASQPRRFFIDSSYPRLEQIRGYALNSRRGLVAFPPGGWGIPLAQRAFPHPRDVFPLTLLPGEQSTIYFAVSARYQRIVVLISLEPYEQMLIRLQWHTLSNGFVSCILLFVFIISMAYFIDSAGRELGNLWYSLYALTNLLFYGIRFDLPYLADVPLNPSLNYLVDMFATALLLFYCLSGYSFMAGVTVGNWFSDNYGRLLTGLTIPGILLLAIPPSDFTLEAALVCRMLLAVTGISGLLLVLIKGVTARNRYALLFVWMFIPLLAAYVALVFAADLSNGAGSHIDAALIMKGIVCVETSLMMMGFIYKNNRLKHQLKQELTEQQKQVLITQIQTQEEERQRIAADLHDDLGATLSVIKGQLQTLQPSQERLSKPIQLMEKAILDLRHISHNLMPPEFAQLGLKEAIQETVWRAEVGSSVHFLFITHGQERRLDNEKELTIYRIAVELINNAMKHAKARRITIQLIFYPQYVSLLVEDDGRGYPVSANKEKAGIGLRNIRSRVAYLQSKLLVDSGEAGTTVTLEVPF